MTIVLSSLFFFLIMKEMLYLFGSGAWKGNRKILKIGFTQDIETRKLQYKLHNPLGEMIKTREGTELDELRLHLRLFDFKVEFLDEWFYDEEEVFKVFDQEYEEINRWLWDNRLQTPLLYPTLPSPGTLKRKILDELRKKYGGSNNLEGQKNL